MARKAAIIAAAIVSLIPIGVFANMEAGKDVPLHHFELPCVNCHESAPPASSSDPRLATEARPLKGDINRLCTTSGCHSFDSLLTHPTGVSAPRDEIPSDMALDEQSRLTCLTCHNRANRDGEFQPAAGRPQRMLYKPAGRQFCGKCHSIMSGSVRVKSHWQFSTRAHLVSEDSRLAGTVGTRQFTGRIDSESRACLSCHDDVFAVIPGYGSTIKSSSRFGRNAGDHPIGMDYAQAASRRAGRFSFVPMADERIRLFAGKVGCGSCHSLYSRTGSALVAPFGRDILCKKCHLL